MMALRSADSWRVVNKPTLSTRPNASGVNSTLMQWGPLQFQVWPLNFYELDHETATDWAHKEIAGAAIYREWVGENDESLYLRGHIYPYRLGGMSNLDLFDSFRRAGASNMLVRGDGRIMGWFVVEKLIRQHTAISAEGVGQQVAFEAVFARVPVPAAESYITTLWGAGLIPNN